MTYIEQNFDGTYRRLLSNIDLQLVNLINNEVEERLNSFNTLQTNLQTVYQSIENINNSTTDALNKIDDIINKTSSLFGTSQNGNYNKNLSILGRLYADAFYVQNTSGPSIITSSTDLNPNLNAEYLQGYVPQDFVVASHKGSRGEQEHGIATATEAGFLSPQDFLKLQAMSGGGGALVTEDEIEPLIQDVEEIKGNLSQLIELNNHVGSGGLAHAEATENSAGFLSSTDKSYLNNLPSAMDYIRILSESNQLSLTGHIGLGGEVHPLATKTIAGFMSAADKAYLELLPQELNSRFNNVNIDDENFNNLKSDVETHIGFGGETQHPNARPELSGFMSAEDKLKLDGIEWNATNYVHPGSHPASMIETDLNKTFVSEIEKTKLVNLYTKEELDNKFAEIGSGLIWKQSVQYYNDIGIVYPSPDDGWTVNVEQDNSTYLYTGEEWIKISGNSYGLATETNEGLMSSPDKVKLNKLNVTGYINLDSINSQFNSLTNDFATKAEITEVQDKLIWVDAVIQGGLIYNAGDGIEISGTTISVEDSGVIPGEYTKVAVNDKGQVIAGYNVDSIADLGFDDVMVFDRDQNGNLLNTISLPEGAQITSNNHLTNKKYVDDLVNSKGDNILRFYAKALADTNVSLTSSSIYSIDGTTIGQGETILLTNQTNAGVNGLYKVIFSNNIYSLVRDDKMPSGLKLESMVMIFIEYGTKYAKTMWGILRHSMPTTFIVGTHPMYISRLQEWIKAGEGIELVKNISGEITVGFKPRNAAKIAITDSNGILTGSNVAAEKIGYLTNVTSDIQTQINNAKKTGYINTGIVTDSNGDFVMATGNILNTTTNQMTSTGKVVTANQVGYLANLTADVQKQINDIKAGVVANNDSSVVKASTSPQAINYGLTVAKNASGDILPENGLFFVNEQGPQINFKKDSTYYYMYFKLAADTAINSGAKAFIFLNDAGTSLFHINNAGAYIKNKEILTAPDAIRTINYPFRIANTYNYDATTPAEALITKGYVDSRTSVDYKESVNVASTDNISSLSGTPIIDTYQTVIGDRVLLKNQAIGSQNGIWIVSSSTWTRPSDFITGAVNTGCQVYVNGGFSNAKSSFVLTTNSSITVDTTALTFEKLATTRELLGGTGISIGSQGNGTLVVGMKQNQPAPLSMPTPAAINGYRVVVADTNGHPIHTALPTLTEINYISGLTSNIQNQVGALSSLNTTNKSSLVGAINELFQSASNGKQAISQALTGLGVGLTGSETFSELANKISTIETSGGSINTTISFYPPASGEVISKGSAVEITASNEIKKSVQSRYQKSNTSIANAEAIGLVKLTEETFVTCYKQGSVISFKIVTVDPNTYQVRETSPFSLSVSTFQLLSNYGTNSFKYSQLLVCKLSSDKFLFISNFIGYRTIYDNSGNHDFSFIRCFVGTVSNGQISFGVVQNLKIDVYGIHINKILYMSDNKISVSYTQNVTKADDEIGNIYLSFIKETNGTVSFYKENKLTNAYFVPLQGYSDAGWGVTHDKIDEKRIVLSYMRSFSYVDESVPMNWKYYRGDKKLSVCAYQINEDDSVTEYSTRYAPTSTLISRSNSVSYNTLDIFEITSISENEFIVADPASMYYYSMRIYKIGTSITEMSIRNPIGNASTGWSSQQLYRGYKGLGIKVNESKAVYTIYENYSSGYEFRDSEIGIITRGGTQKATVIFGGNMGKIFFGLIGKDNLIYIATNTTLSSVVMGFVTTSSYSTSSTNISIQSETLNRQKIDGVAISDINSGRIEVMKNGLTDKISNINVNKIYYVDSSGNITEEFRDEKIGIGVGKDKLLLTINPLVLNSENSAKEIMDISQNFPGTGISISMTNGTQELISVPIPEITKIIDISATNNTTTGAKTFIKINSTTWNSSDYSISVQSSGYEVLKLRFFIENGNLKVTRTGQSYGTFYSFVQAIVNIKFYE